MNNWLRWILPGVVISALLTFAAVEFQRKTVEEDITTRTKTALMGRHPWVEIVPEGRDVKLGGTAPTENAVDEALELAAAVYGIRTVTDATTRLDIVSPYLFNAEKRNNELLISGHAPDAQTRNAILSAAGLMDPATEVSDQLEISAGAPAGFRELAIFSLLQLKDLSNGKISLVDSGLEISGRTENSHGFSKLMERYAGEIPAGINLVGVDVSPPVAVPFTWRADFDGQRFLLSGYTADEDTSTLIMTKLKEEFSGKDVVDRTQLASGAPKNFQDAITYLLEFFSSFETGRVSVSDNRIAVSGTAGSGSDLEALRERLESGPEGFVFVERTILPSGVSPYSWSLQNDGEKLVIDGYSPGFEVSQLIRKLIDEKFPSLEIEGQMVIAGGWSQTYGAAVSHAIELLSHLENGSVKIIDSQINISGTAKTADDYQRLLSEKPTKPEGTEVTLDIVPALANPYRWNINKDEQGIRAGGNISSEKGREEVSRHIKAAFEKEPYDDRQVLASGEPEGAMNARRLLIDYVGKLTAGQGNLIGNRISLVGRVDSREIASAIEQDFLANLPAGFTGTTNILFPKADQSAANSSSETGNSQDIDPMSVESPGLPVADPYRWSISKIPSGVTVLGNAPNGFAAKSVIDLVKSIFSVSEVADKQILASGKPEYFFEVQKILMRQVSLLEAGQGNVIGNQVSVSGRARNENIRNLIDRALEKQLPRGYSGSTNIVFPKTKALTPDPVENEGALAENCQAKILEAIDGRSIEFETNLSAIKKESEGVLNDVIKAALDCPEVRIEVSGHTDSHGRDAFNLELSAERAETVVKYMVSAGVDGDRLDPKGYGETTPIADNGTAAGRSENRRIEFRVIQ